MEPPRKARNTRKEDFDPLGPTEYTDYTEGPDEFSRTSALSLSNGLGPLDRLDSIRKLFSHC